MSFALESLSGDGGYTARWRPGRSHGGGGPGFSASTTRSSGLGNSRAQRRHHCRFGLMVFSSAGRSAGPSVDGGPGRAGREEPPQFAGGRGDRRGMGERVAEKAGQQ